jgi:hypothetical protein
MVHIDPLCANPHFSAETIAMKPKLRDSSPVATIYARRMYLHTAPRRDNWEMRREPENAIFA